MTEALDPQNLTPTASINRVRIVELPGVDLRAEGIEGKTASYWLSSEAVAQRVREQADALQIPAAYRLDTAQLLLILGQRLQSADPSIREAAEDVAAQFGRRLGYMILALKRGDPANRQARPEWNDSYWDHWASIRTIWLGGGLVSGQFGAHLRRQAEEVLARAGVTGCRVMVSGNPSLLPLIGAARSAPTGVESMLVFDFGGTLTKRACALYKDQALSALHVFPPLPAAAQETAQTDNPYIASRQLAASMVSTVLDTWTEAETLGFAPAPSLVGSLANYVVDGQLARGLGGLYTILRLLSDDTPGWFSQHLTGRLRQPVGLTFLHDGTAAARAYAGEKHAAVIMLGTALGIGFPPASEDLRPIAPDFRITTTATFAAPELRR